MVQLFEHVELLHLTRASGDPRCDNIFEDLRHVTLHVARVTVKL